MYVSLLTAAEPLVVAVQNWEYSSTGEGVGNNPAVSWPQTPSLSEPCSDIPGCVWAITEKNVRALLSTHTIDCQYLCITCAVLWDTLNIKRHYIQPATLLSPVLGFNFHHTVTASYHIHTAGSFPEAWPPHSDHSMALQLPGKKACQALMCAPAPFSSPNGTKELRKSDHSW